MPLASHRRTSSAFHMSLPASRLSPLALDMPPLASHKWMRVEAQRLPLLLQLAQLAQPQLLERQVQLLALERAPHLSISLWFSSFSCCQILREQKQPLPNL